jgi:hypothetical protein
MLSFRSSFSSAMVLMCLLVGLTLINDAASLLQLWLLDAKIHMFSLLSMAFMLWPFRYGKS